MIQLSEIIVEFVLMGSVQNLVRIKNITLLFIISVVLIFATIGLYFAMNDKKENIEGKIKLKTTQLDLAFNKKVFELQNNYNNKLEEFINNNEELIDAFAKRNRDRLDQLTQIKLDQFIQENPNFELICFGLPDMTAFYRAHMPKKFGDDISGVHGIQTVNKLKKRVSGFLISKLGLYYRVTFPVFKKGEYIGLIAFGINLNYVNDYLHDKFATESAIIVDTKSLKQSKWFDMLEEGSVGGYTVISSNGELIDKLAKSNLNVDANDIKIEDNNKIYSIINNINIKGIKNKAIAKVLLFQDITYETTIYERYFYTFVIVLSIMLVVLSVTLVKTFNKFLNTIININDDLKDLNIHLEERVEEEVQKNREKEQQLFEQSKRAQLGEMIGNIAHQWRQPLSVISSSVSALELHMEMGSVTQEETRKTLTKVFDTTQYLSSTIDDFRNFLSQKKEVSDFILQDEVNKAITIIDATLKSNHIKLIKQYHNEPVKMHSIAGEISQVLLNVINNSKDAFEQSDKENKEITIKILPHADRSVLLIIEDNAGGIPIDILPKIFDPYFTTKHQSQGTGIGLYMSNNIITQSLNGRIIAANGSKGAIFTIEIPINNIEK